MKSAGTYIYINAIEQLMQRQMQYIRCNKAIQNIYDAMKQNSQLRLEGASWSILIIFLMHQICWFHFCCKKIVINAHCRCSYQWQTAVRTCQVLNWTQLQSLTGGGVEGGGRGWGGDVGSSVSSSDSHWCEGEKGSPQLWQFSSLLDRERGEVLRANLIWPGPLRFSGEDGVAAGWVSRGGPCFILLWVFSPFSEAAL